MKRLRCTFLAVMALGFGFGAHANETVCVAVGVAYVDENGNGARDEGEPGLPGVQISDGDLIVTTDSEGRYELATTNAIPNTVFVINPNGYRVTTPFFRLVSGPSIEGDFGLAPDPASEAGPFSFYHTADFQFDSPRDATEQVEADLADMEQIAQSQDIRFYAVCGDITTHGEVDDLAFFNEQFSQLARPVYRIFGGHDALVEMPRPKMGNWVDAFGPYTYAWNHGGVHFIALVSEGYLSDEERARQTRFWQRDMDALAPDTPIVLLAHTPDQISSEIGEAIRKHNVIAYLFGHWHTHHRYEVDGVPFFTSSPMRPSDWGGFTKRTRSIRYEKGALTSSSRVLEQRKRIHVLQPHGTVMPGPLTIRAHVYDTATIPERVEARITGAQEGSILPVSMHQENDFTWAGNFPEALPPGDYEVHLDAGDGWAADSAFQVAHDVPAIEAGENWRDTFGGANRARTPGTAYSPALHLQWAATLPGEQPHQTSPIILDGRVYLGVSDLQAGAAHAGVVCLDGSSGEMRWTKKLPRSINSGICSDGERIFAVDGQGGVYALRPDTGEILWQSDAYSGTPFHEDRRYYWRSFLAPVTTADGRLFVAGSYVLAAFDTASGKRLWGNYDDLCRNAYPMSGLAPADGLVFFENESHVVALDQETGEIRWTRALADLAGGVSRERGTATPLATNQAVYFHHRSRMRALNPSTGDEIWSASSGGSMNYMGVPAKAKDAVVVTSGRNVICIDAETGERRWAVATRAAHETDLGMNQDLRNGAAPLVIGDWVIVASDDGYIYVLSLEDGERRWEYNTGAPIKASPAVSGNLVVVNNFAGNVFGFVLQEIGE